MDNLKKERFLRELQRAAAAFILSASNRSPLITVTNVSLSKKEKKAFVHVSVYPEKDEEHALTFLKRKEHDARDYFREHIRIGFLPTIEFVLDEGEKSRQKFDVLLEREKGGATETDTV